MFPFFFCFAEVLIERHFLVRFFFQAPSLVHVLLSAPYRRSQRKKLVKLHGAQKKEHDKYLAKCAADGVAAMGV